MTIKAIDLKVGMTYRRLPSHDWATADSISYTYKRGVISGVKVEDVGGGGMTIGSGACIYVKEDN